MTHYKNFKNLTKKEEEKMEKEEKKWIPVVSDAKEEEASVKKVVSSNFKDVRMKTLDESAVGSTKVTYQVRGIWEDIFSFKGTDYDTLNVPDAGRMQIEGSPEIPQEGLFVAIPENAEVKEVKVISKKEKELDAGYYILPASKPVLEGEEPEYIPNKEIYESGEPFPGKDIEFIGTKYVAGRKVAHIMIYIVQYKPKSKKVMVLESIDLEVIYETSTGMDAKVKRMLLRRSPMEQMILDSNNIAEAEESRMKTEKEGERDSGVDTSLHSSGNEGEYLIITTNDLKNSVETLVHSKEVNHKVKVVTKENIISEFPKPHEDESIREFIKYAVANWNDPPEWVVLAGDVDKIPTHIANYETSHPSLPPNFASDHYYADLGGDLTPEIVVSRLPASNIKDMDRLCSRAASYASSYSKKHGTWKNKILLTAYQSSGYKNCKDDIFSMIGTRFNGTKKYAGLSTKQEVIDKLNAGVVIVNYRGHGGDTSWSASNGLDANDVRNLNNGDKIPLVFSIACWNAHIDMSGECFGEIWMKNEKAITFLGATRPSWTSPNHDFDKYLFDAIINHGLSMAGDIMNWAKTKLYLNYPGTTARDNIRMYLLLGDPTAGVYFIGNENTKEIHVPDCYWVTQMYAGNKVYFHTIEEAITKGYNGCHYCLKEYDTG